MRKKILLAATLALYILPYTLQAQIGKRFPAERKVVTDPLTRTQLIFLTSTPAGDSKIYPTHSQWTADGEWVIFRSNRARNEALAVNEKTGDIVQVTEGGYTGMLCVARRSMKLYFMRNVPGDTGQRRSGAFQVMETDLQKVFDDSKNGKIQAASVYQRICGTIPASIGAAGGDMALDADEDLVYFRVGKEEGAKHLPANTKIENAFGPRNMGAGPAGLMSMNIKTGELKYIVSVPFQIGHVQSNPWVPGEIVFCWETGGKSPQRTWTVKADGTGLRPLYPEADYEWVTHEAVITKDEVAFAIMGHRPVKGTDTSKITPGTPVGGANPGQEPGWGNSGTREKPTGLGIANLRTRTMKIAGQTHEGSGLWHVHGSPDGRWAVGDDFRRNIYLIDRQTGELKLLSAGHKATAADHPHPTFSVDSKKIEIQSAMLSEDGRSMNICIIPVPDEWLERYAALETGGQKMPDEWIDRDTKHKVIKLTRNEGRNSSFYFHNNPFIGNKMVYYNTTGNSRQIHLLDLATLKSEQLTFHSSPMNGEIVHNKSGKVFYQIKDSVFVVDAQTKKSQLVYVFPDDFKASITTVNADGTLLGGAKSDDKEKEIFRQNPEKKDYFNLIYEAKLPRTLFTIDISKKKLNKIFTDSAWLNHVQFSSTDPSILMFCHEGPWHKVDRIWTINVKTKKVMLMHKRTMDVEIAGHEWFSHDGKTIWFDLQQPRSQNFFVAGADVATGAEKKYSLQRDEWSIHFNLSPDQKLFCGDGGDPGQVARAKDGMWIYLFRPEGDKFVSERLVNMKHHNYKLEPNVHFSPDGKWVIFRANFEGVENVYAVEINKQ